MTERIVSLYLTNADQASWYQMSSPDHKELNATCTYKLGLIGLEKKLSGPR